MFLVAGLELNPHCYVGPVHKTAGQNHNKSGSLQLMYVFSHILLLFEN